MHDEFITRHLYGEPSQEELEKEREDLHALYPHFTDEQVEEARLNLDRYLEVALRIYDRIKDDPDLPAKLAETKEKSEALRKQVLLDETAVQTAKTRRERIGKPPSDHTKSEKG